MRKQIHPAVAATVIAVFVIALGAFLYSRSGYHGKPFKPADAMLQPGFKDALQKRYDELKAKQGNAIPP